MPRCYRPSTGEGSARANIEKASGQMASDRTEGSCREDAEGETNWVRGREESGGGNAEDSEGETCSLHGFPSPLLQAAASTHQGANALAPNWSLHHSPEAPLCLQNTSSHGLGQRSPVGTNHPGLAILCACVCMPLPVSLCTPLPTHTCIYSTSVTAGITVMLLCNVVTRTQTPCCSLFSRAFGHVLFKQKLIMPHGNSRSNLRLVS